VARSAVYLWDYSLDLKTWTSVPQTMKASTTIAGLTMGQVYYFRFHAQTRKGVGNYSQVVSLLVH
jgi:spore coat protein U-like protein